MAGRIKTPEVEEERERPKTVYAIYEGERTEPDYFSHFHRTYRGRTSFIIESIPKDSFDISQTNRTEMFKLAKGHIDWLTKGTSTPYRFATVVLHDFFDAALGELGITDAHDNGNAGKLVNSLRKARDSCVKKSTPFSNDGYISNADGFLSVIYDEINAIKSKTKGLEDLDYQFTRIDSINGHGSTFNKQRDRVFIVFDRDVDRNNPWNNSPKEYEDIVNRCNREGYDVLLSTPLFEFWLLLHHDGVCIGDYSPESGCDVSRDLKKRENANPDANYKRIDAKRYETYYKDNFERALTASTGP